MKKAPRITITVNNDAKALVALAAATRADTVASLIKELAALLFG